MTPLQHLQLLLRFDRTFNLRQIIREVVRPGQRVLDAGCGLGVLGQWAAQAGGIVTAVDLDDIDLSKRLAAENGLADRIAFHQANLFDLLLQRPELKNGFDIIIAMVYLNDPRRDERQTELARKLKEQFLKPGGTTIPTHVEYQASLGAWSEQDFCTRQRQIDRDIASISQRYGLQFDSLRSELQKKTWKEHFPERTPDGNLCRSGYRHLGKATRPFVIDYRTPATQYPSELAFEADCPGVANVVLWTQRLMFEKALIFANESISWIEQPISVVPNQKVSVLLDAEWRARNVFTALGPTPIR